MTSHLMKYITSGLARVYPAYRVNPAFNFFFFAPTKKSFKNLNRKFMYRLNIRIKRLQKVAIVYYTRTTTRDLK